VTAPAPGEDRFRELAEPLLSRPGVTRSTMMGLPCMRVDGAFFAAFDRRRGDLLVKLTRDRVDELVDGGRAGPFAPAGRRFREWAAVPATDADSWPALLDQALRTAPTLAPRARRSRR
jgi:hypothetical protein